MANAWRPPRRGIAPLHDAREFWLFGLFRTFGVVVVAYFSAVFVFLVLTKVSQLPSGPLWDDSLRPAFLFILVAVVFGLCLVPVFQREWDATLRSFSMFTATFLVAYGVFSATGFVDPNVPFKLLVQYVFEPLQRMVAR